MKRLICFLMMAAIGTMLAGHARAVPLFSDNYENVSPGAFAKPFVDGVEDVGFASYYSGSALAQDGTTGFSGGASGFTGIPNGPIGKNFLDVPRDSDGSPNHFAYFKFTTQSNVGDQIHAEFNLYAETGLFQLGLASNAPVANNGNVHIINQGLILLTATAGNGFIQSFNGASQQLFQLLTFTANTWQKWEIDYVIGDPNFLLTVDGLSESINAMVTPGGPVNGIYFTQGGGLYGVDDVLVTVVPEPASILLCSSAALGLVLLRKRRDVRGNGPVSV